MSGSAPYEPVYIEGLEAILERFDHLLLDQWGVLHDGQRLFPQVRSCVEAARARGKTVTILSNSGRRGSENVQRIAEMGLPRAAYDHIVTSGDAAWAALSRRAAPPFDRLGRRCLLFVRGTDRSMVDSLDLALVSEVREADFILLAGMDDGRADLDRWDPLLREAAAARLPMICTNPDTTMISPLGLLPGPGAVAGRYRALGGAVTYVGKPHRQIYETVLDTLGHPPPGRILAVGDSLDHDVLGAHRMGMATLFVTNGVHAPHFSSATGGPAIRAALHRLAGSDKPLPDYVMRELAWAPIGSKMAESSCK